MPLKLHKYLRPIGELGIWDIREEEAHFQKALLLDKEEQKILQEIKGRKRIEWLAARQLVHTMSGRELRGSFYKDEHGKPHIKDSPYHISISHSHNLAAAIAAPEKVGIDIQILVSKIERVAHKFMRDIEMNSLSKENRLEHLHVYWGAKESLYKAYGRRKLDFCKNILVEPFEYDLKQGKAKGWVEIENHIFTFQLYYEKIGEYILVYSIENSTFDK